MSPLPSRIDGFGLAALAFALVLVPLLLLGPPAAAEDFVRGDANGDGAVSISDAWFVTNHLLGPGPAPTCRDSADVDDDGQLGRSDAEAIARYSIGKGPPPAAPFPAAGPDPTEDALTCASYGGGSRITDSPAKMEVRDVSVAGGDVRGGLLTLAVTSPLPIVGYSATLLDVSGVIEDMGVSVDLGSDRTGTLLDGFLEMTRDPTEPRRWRVAFLCSFADASREIGAVDDTGVLDIPFCLKPHTTAAGEYRILLEEAELVDVETGRAIEPMPFQGVLTVRAQVDHPECTFPAVDPPWGGEEFIRGDANGDRKVSISDAGLLLGYFFLGTPRDLACMAACDADDDSNLDLSDAIVVLHQLFTGPRSIPPPFPDPGPDPTPDSYLDCRSYGKGAPLEDSAADVKIASALCPGGSERRASVAVTFSMSQPVAGYALRIRDEAGVLEDESLDRWNGLRDLAIVPATGERVDFVWGSIAGGVVQVALYGRFTEPVSIPAGQDVPAFEILACVKPGTPAGEYPLTVEAAEFCSTGNDQGRALYPALTAGVLRVVTDVEGPGTCDTSVTENEPPEPIHILFKLEETAAIPGGSASIPFIIKADRATTGFSYSIDFDEGTLQAVRTRRLWEKPGGTAFEFEKFEWNNENLLPGNGGVDEGFLVGAAVISLTDTEDVLPVDEEVEVLVFDFVVLPDATAGQSDLVFLDGGWRQSGGLVKNKLIAGGTDITPALAGSFVFVNGRINIVPDGTPFVRGDSNGDGGVNISDPSFTLGHLFLGGPPPWCLDAADANDDGKIDISDAIATLQYLFLGGTTLPPPLVAPGDDPTDDALGICF